MEDSEFSSDFAVSFLTWDEDEVTGPSSGPSDHRNSSTVVTKLPVQAISTQESTSTQNVTGIPPFQYLISPTVENQQNGSLATNGNPNISNFSTIPNVMQTAFNIHNTNASTPASNSTTTSTGAPAQINQNLCITRPHAPSSLSIQTTQTSATTPQAAFQVDTTTLKAPQLHPLGIQSSANCPPHISGILPAAPPNTQFLPQLMYNPLLQNSTATSNQQLLAVTQASNGGQHQHISHSQLQPNQQHQQQQHSHLPMQIQQMTQLNRQQPQSQPANATQDPVPHSRPVGTHVLVPIASMQKPTTVASSSSMNNNQQGLTGISTTQQSTKSVPPFYLFDAPCELRTNFIASQRMHNLPISEDNNSFHYGMAVNGFHPQLNAQVNPVLPLPGVTLPPGTVQLVDARSKKNRKTGKERNEREQKRAQKITELIEKLRISMERGGWKVEMKSKYHTLSTCADYLKHLVKDTKEKQDAVEKAKSDLEMKERKMEEAARSDPESVTSSLTASTSNSLRNKHSSIIRKRSSFPDDRVSKKSKINDISSEESSSNGSQDSSGSSVNNISLHKISSNVSDITDSNRGTSSESGDRHKVVEKVNCPSTSSISSTAAVARGTAREHGHADIVIKNKTPLSWIRKGKETTSIDSEFELDYEEVFVSSNVPQLIATTAGRIVTCNHFFTKVTGLSKEEISRLTIFSIVQGDKLSNLFEMLGEALRCGSDNLENKTTAEVKESRSSSSTATTSESESSESIKRWNYAAMTLPCVSFPSRTHAGKIHHPNPLYMTMTLMTDENPRKRCFHCILTDNPGTNGAIGFVTPELLAMLFNDSELFEVSNAESSSSKDVETSNSNTDPDTFGETAHKGIEVKSSKVN